MLVPLDGSDLAEQALPFAVALTEKLDLETTLLQVCEVEASSSFYTCRTYIDRTTQALTGQLDEAKKSKAKVAIASPAIIKGETVTGIVPDSILIYAERHEPDLILISRHGRSGTRGFLLGSVAHRILTGARTPVMIVHPESTPGIMHADWPRTVLVLVDGSKLSERILPLAEDMAGESKRETQITLFKVCEPPDIRADYPEAIMPMSWEEHVEKAKNAAMERCENYLSTLQTQLAEKGLNAMTHSVMGERVVDEVLKYAHEQPFDLIAMTTHGQSGTGEWPFGHIADRLIQSSQLPLLLIRPRPTEAG